MNTPRELPVRPPSPQREWSTAGPADEHERELVIADRRPVADGVVELTLRDGAGGDLPEWSPGAHIDLVLGPGLVRQYSLCGSPEDRGAWRVAVLAVPDGRGGSRHVHDRLHPAATVRVRGPRNHFGLVRAERYLLIAGGIGITPLLPMAESLEAAGADWSLVYGGRSRTSMAYLDELAAYGSRVLFRPQDEFGLLELDRLLAGHRAGTLVYCCGPEGLLDAVAARCADWAPGTVRFERFSAPAAAPDVDRAGFVVEFRRSGLRLEVPPHSSILEVAQQAGVPVMSSCGEGTCGTCETDVLEGVPEHRDSVLDEDERSAGSSLMICVSRSRTPTLALDL